MEDIKPYITEIEQIKEYNQLKVMSAMNEANLSDFHLADSTGYGYSDLGLETIEQVYSLVFKAEDALVRPQIISGTHAITLCLFGVLRPGDELVSVTGAPYDTLQRIISRENCGSFKDLNISYKQVELKADGKPDYAEIKKNISSKTKMVLIQRSMGYSLRPALTIDEISELINFVKNINKNIVCFVDNCYGEFVDKKEPIEVGADLCAGSLIKNPGGGIAPSGGYIVGKEDLVEQCCYRLIAPGMDKYGPSLTTNRLIMQGLFYSPLVVSEALKGATFSSRFMEKAGFKVFPKFSDKRGDIVTAVIFNSKNLLISFCQGIQKVGPVDAHVSPVPWSMPGYDHEVIMAGGSFIQGSSIELSADGPVREPYVAYIQGGISFPHIKIGVMKAYQELLDKNLI